MLDGELQKYPACLPRIGLRGISPMLSSLAGAAAGEGACGMAPLSGVVLDGVDMAAYGVDRGIGRPCLEVVRVQCVRKGARWSMLYRDRWLACDHRERVW